MSKLSAIVWYILLSVELVLAIYHLIILLSQYIFGNIIRDTREGVKIVEHYSRTGRYLRSKEHDTKLLSHAAYVIMIITNGFLIELATLSIMACVAWLFGFRTQAVGLSILLLLDILHGAKNVSTLGMNDKEAENLRKQIIVRHIVFIVVLTANVTYL